MALDAFPDLQITGEQVVGCGGVPKVWNAHRAVIWEVDPEVEGVGVGLQCVEDKPEVIREGGMRREDWGEIQLC